jgi:hypothetical protein
MMDKIQVMILRKIKAYIFEKMKIAEKFLKINILL